MHPGKMPKRRQEMIKNRSEGTEVG